MFAEAQSRVRPERGAAWMECSGIYAVFNGVTSPATQTFGLGIFEETTADSLDRIECFFFERNAPVLHEVSPFAGAATMEMLCDRRYRPVEISNVMYRRAEMTDSGVHPDVRVRVAGPGEEGLWSDVMAQGWRQEHPELVDFFNEHGAISVDCQDSVRFLAELDGKPGAAGTLCVHGGVALLAGAATIPELRRRGLQTALIEARMNYAADHECGVMMVVVEPGSDSQRNAERDGFRVAYTRTKWRLFR